MAEERNEEENERKEEKKSQRQIERKRRNIGDRVQCSLLGQSAASDA
jgi:hypothetical protein